MKKILPYLFLSVTLFSYSQQKLWKGYFSYNEITDVCISPSKVYASTKNAGFHKDVASNILTTFTSINDVKPDEITAIFQTSNNHTLIGNKNGLIIIVKPDGSTLDKVDIIIEVPVPANSKKINDFYEFNGKVYVSTQYGISVIKLSNFEIEDNFYIGTPSQLYIDVLQTTVFNGEIFATTRTNGIKKATLSNPFLYDYSQWSVFNSGNWMSLVTFNNQLVGMNSDGYSYKFLGNSPQQFSPQFGLGLKLRTDNTYLTISYAGKIAVYNQSFSLVSSVNQIPNFPDTFTCAITKNDKLYIGTKKSGFFETTVVNPMVFTNMSPNGPIEDYAFKVTKTTNDLWLTHGSYDRTYNPDYKLQGISIFNKNSGWSTIPTTEVQGVVSLAAVAQNPRNLSEVFVASGHSGMLKFTNKANAVLFNQTNFLESLVDTADPNYISVRINGMKYDKEGNLWLTNARVNNGIKVLKNNNTWQSYNLNNIIQGPDWLHYGNIDIDKNGTKWVATYAGGVIGFNEKFNNKYIIINEENGNLPNNDVRCVAVDNKNQLWIGTFKGLRILNSVDRFISESSLSTTNIVIQEGDLAQELFYQQVIQDIKVDGSNNKWVAIADAGVFQVSQNGQITLRRFTKENSPLPSNNVLDIDIDEVTGEVFFATDKGLVSYLGSSTKGSEDLADVYVYPNPVRPGYSGTVKIAGLMDKVNLKITDIEGNLVFETTSSGGTVEWDTTAFGKYKVASGVYMVFVTSSDAAETTVKKIMVVR